MSRPGDDVGRLFELLINVLAEQHPKKLSSPFEASEPYQKILPYKVHRRALGLDSHQDYEMAVLRFLSGERGYAVVSPAEVRDALIEEIREVDPNPGVLRDYAASKVTLNVEAVRAVLNPHGAYAPPGTEFAPPAVPEPEEQAPPVQTTTEPVAAALERSFPAPSDERLGTCPHCGAGLPGRRALYCPFCGGQASMDECAKCGAGLETVWVFCASCGHGVVGWDADGAGA